MISQKTDNEYINVSTSLADEISSTMLIENIETRRDSVSNILMVNMPRIETEEKIYGLKSGYEYIGNSKNRINEESIHELYQLSINKHLDVESRLPNGIFYKTA